MMSRAIRLQPMRSEGTATGCATTSWTLGELRFSPSAIARAVLRRHARSLLRVILRYADRGGRLPANLERCSRHAHEAIERNTKAGLTVLR